MSLLNTFSKKTTAELVAILEGGENYTAKAKEAASSILELKKIDNEELILEAEEYWKTHLNSNIKSYLISKEKPISNFLNDQQIAILFNLAFNKWKENQKTFEIDTTKYWFV